MTNMLQRTETPRRFLNIPLVRTFLLRHYDWSLFIIGVYIERHFGSSQECVFEWLTCRSEKLKCFAK